MKRIMTVMLVLIFAFAFTALRAAEEAKPAAEGVTTAAQEAKKWDQMSEKERDEARAAYVKMNESSEGVKKYLDNGAKKFEGLSASDKKKLQKAYAEWEKLSPQMKESMLEKYKKWMDMSPEEREKIKEAYKKYKNASPDEKAKIREEIKDRDKSEAK